MWLIAICVILIIIFGCVYSTPVGSNGTSSTPIVNSSPTTIPNQKYTVKKTVPPIGKKLSWDNIADISFALGSFMAGLDASGYIGAYENGTLSFNIRNFTPAFNRINERVPTDIIEFLAMNPSIIKRKQVGDTTLFQIEFTRSFPVNSPKTRENIAKSAEDILKIIQKGLQEGANSSFKLTGTTRIFAFRIESPEYTASKTLWIK